MSDMKLPDFLRALGGFDPYFDSQIDRTDQKEFETSFARMDADSDGVVTENEALEFEPTTARETLSLVHLRESMRMSGREVPEALEARMDRVDRMQIAQIVTSSREREILQPSLLRSVWLSTLDAAQLLALEPGDTYSPGDVESLNAELDRLVSALRAPEPMSEQDGRTIGLVVATSGVMPFVPQGSALLARHRDRYERLVEALSEPALGQVMASIGDQTRNVLVGENHLSDGAAVASRQIIERLAESGRPPAAVVIEAERHLNTDEFRAVMERYAGRELSASQEGELRRELRLALDDYEGNRRIGFSENKWDWFFSPEFPAGVRRREGSYITRRFDLESPTRHWQAFEDLFVAAARAGTRVHFIDHFNEHDGRARDDIMVEEIQTLRREIGDDALIVGAFGWWHVQEVVDTRALAAAEEDEEGKVSLADIGSRPLGFLLGDEEATLSVAITRYNGHDTTGVDLVFKASEQGYHTAFDRPED
ncbi:MAG: hypothetical protein AAF658_14030 [Myxococcota bacterium]